MMKALIAILRRPLTIAVFAIVLGGIAGVSAPAHARVWIGFGFPLFGPPAYYPPPVYYPPPAYYPPPPAYYPAPYPAYPPPAGRAIAGQACYAGGTVCPMERPVTPGSGCYCTTAQGRAWGRAS
jgi:hypothetical protein